VGFVAGLIGGALVVAIQGLDRWPPGRPDYISIINFSAKLESIHHEDGFPMSISTHGTWSAIDIVNLGTRKSAD
jgi:hypothetical protein